MPDQDQVKPEVLQKVCELVAQTLRVKVEDVKPDASLPNDLGAESIDLLELRFLLEKNFKVPLSEKEIRAAAQGKSAADISKNLTSRAIAREISKRLGSAPPG